MMDIPPSIVESAIAQTQVLPASSHQLPVTDFSNYLRNIRLRYYIDRIISKNESLGVTTGVSIIDLQSQRSLVAHNIDTEQFAASVNKLPIAELILNDLRSGKLKADQVLKWNASDVRAGSGKYDQPEAPLRASVQDLLFDILNPSGNTAARVLVNKGLGGAAVVNERFSRELNLQHTYLQPLDDNRFYLGNSTAREALTVLSRLLSANDEHTAFIKNALATNIYTDYGVRSQLAGNDYIVLANKVGILDDPEGNNRHDVGIVYNTQTQKSYGYAFMNTAFGEPYNTATSQAGVSLADMGKGLLRHADDKAARQEPRLLNLKHQSPQPEANRMQY